MESSIKRGILAVLCANIINLIFNLLTNFLLPKYLSIDSYSAIKTFQLYTTYVGVFALGCSDGMYLRYGGKDIKKIDKNKFASEIHSFRTFISVISISAITFAFFTNNKIVIAFSYTILSMNMIGYLKNFYQAVGAFDLYGKILNYSTIVTFILNTSLLLIVKTDDYYLYLIGYAVVDVLVWIVLELDLHKRLYSTEKAKLSLAIVWTDIRNGFLLMVGNFSSILLSSMDRLFVKGMMGSFEFAYYSFAVSLEGFLNVAITPITTTFYNYFCNHSQIDDVTKMRKYVMLFGSIIIASAFPAKFVVDVYLKSYAKSMNVLFILFASQIPYIIVKGIYLNLYKASLMQKKYFQRLTAILAIGAILNYLYVILLGSMEAFAFATLSTAVIWLVISACDFREFGFSIKEAIYVALEICLFILLGIYTNSVIGFALYIIATVTLMKMLFRNESLELTRMFFNTLKRKKQ